MRQLSRGVLVCIEGIDGSGKSSQVALLVENLHRHGYDAVSFFEPSEGSWGRKIRELAREGRTVSPEEERDLFLNDRREDVEDNIGPALSSGKVVVMDRYYYSNMAYQGALGLDMEEIKAANEEFSPVPDIVIVLDVEPGTGRGRIESREAGFDHFEGDEYQARVRKNYLLMERYPNVKIVDAAGSREEVSARIMELVILLLEEFGA